MLAAKDVVNQVAKLVKESLDVLVLHQAIAGLGIGKIADQHANGQLHAGHAALQAELRRVLVLLVARMHVQVDRPKELVVRIDIVGFDIGMPLRRAQVGLVGHVEQLGSQGQQAIFHLVIMQIRPQRLGIEVKLALLRQTQRISLLPILNCINFWVQTT